MQLVLRNEAAAFLDWWDVAERLDPVHRALSWGESVERPAGDVFASYFPRFGRREDLESALARFETEAETVRAALERLLDSLELLATSVAGVFNLPRETSVDVVVMVGLYGSNAWTIDVNDLPVSFLAVERLPESSGTCDALVAHELAHAAHRCLRPHPWPGDSESRPGAIAVKLVEEALAVAASTIVVPGLDDARYAAFDDRDQAWFEQCRAQHEQIVATAVRSPVGDGPSEYDALFAREPTSALLPARSGYYLARVVAERFLASPSDLRSIARLSSGAAAHQLVETLAGA